MGNKLNKRRAVYLVLGIILGFAALSMFIYLWNTLGARGLYADETNTSGYTTGLETVMEIAVLSCTVAAVVCVWKAVTTGKNTKS